MESTTLILCVALFSLAAAQIPQRCFSPTKWHAHRLEMNPENTYESYARISYDAIEERIAIFEDFDKNNQRINEDTIVLYRQGIKYSFNPETKQCKKYNITESFSPVEIPANANFYGTRYIGSKGYNMGVEVDLWGGDTPKGRYVGSWTRLDCIPVDNVYKSMSPSSSEATFLVQRFYDVELGFDPGSFIPPEYCQ